MNILNKIGLIFLKIGALGFISILGYGIYIEFGWLGTAIFLIVLFITLGGCFICID